MWSDAHFWIISWSGEIPCIDCHLNQAPIPEALSRPSRWPLAVVPRSRWAAPMACARGRSPTPLAARPARRTHTGSRTTRRVSGAGDPRWRRVCERNIGFAWEAPRGETHRGGHRPPPAGCRTGGGRHDPAEAAAWENADARGRPLTARLAATRKAAKLPSQSWVLSAGRTILPVPGNAVKVFAETEALAYLGQYAQLINALNSCMF